MGEDYKDEFLRVIGRDGIRCAMIIYDAGLPEDDETEYYALKEGYTEEEFEEFLGELEGKRTIIGYSESFGHVWMKDGSWYRRGYEDVMDWWELVRVPEVPSYLKQTETKLTAELLMEKGFKKSGENYYLPDDSDEYDYSHLEVREHLSGGKFCICANHTGTTTAFSWGISTYEKLREIYKVLTGKNI